MKKIAAYILIISVLYFSCKPNESPTPTGKRLIKETCICTFDTTITYIEYDNTGRVIKKGNYYYIYGDTDTTLTIRSYHNESKYSDTEYILNKKAYIVSGRLENSYDTTYHKYTYNEDGFLIKKRIWNKHFTVKNLYEIENENVKKATCNDSGIVGINWKTTIYEYKYYNKESTFNFSHSGIDFYGRGSKNLLSESKNNDIVYKYEYKFDNDGDVNEKILLHYYEGVATGEGTIEYYYEYEYLFE